MGKPFDLQAFQADLTRRIEAAAGRDLSTSRLGFVSGGQNWLVALDDIAEVITPPFIVRVPGAKAWFHGVVNVRGVLHTVSDFADFCGRGVTPAGSAQRLLLAHPRFGVNAALIVDATRGLSRLADLVPDSAPPPPYARQCYRDRAGAAWNDLDLAALCADPAFIAVETGTA
jgi:twitching motility protein PilI